MKTKIILMLIALLAIPAVAAAQDYAFKVNDPSVMPKTETSLINSSAYVAAENAKTKQYGFGFEVHTNYVPEWFLHIAMRGAHDVIGSGFGATVMMRTKNVDIALKGMYWKIDAPNGIYLGINHDWVDAEYTTFKDFGLAYLEFSATWNTHVMGNLYFIYGFGIGGGVVLGEIQTTPAYGCTSDNFKNPGTSNTSACWYNPAGPWEDEDIPPGMGMLEVFGGLRYDVMENITVKAEVGIFLPGFLRGTLGLEFLF